MSNDRYSRQIRLPVVGQDGQAELARASVVIVGCGALGGVASELLARAGVGRITIIDRDYVDSSNLQRQFLFEESDASDALPKAIAAARRLKRINSDIQIHGMVDDLRPRNATELLDGAHAILDATDNFETRYLINDYAVMHGIPWIYGAAVGTYGVTMPILPGDSACFRCIYPNPPSGTQPTCETAGVLGTVTALIASLQATVALQILSGHSVAVRRTIVTCDVWGGPLREIAQPERSPDCPCCVHRRFEWLEGEHAAPVSLCGRDAVQIHAHRLSFNLKALQARLEPAEKVRANEFALRFAPEGFDITVFADGRAIIKGTTDIGVARSLYARWIG